MGWVLISERDRQRVEVLTSVITSGMEIDAAAAVLTWSRRQVHRRLSLYR